MIILCNELKDKLRNYIDKRYNGNGVVATRMHDNHINNIDNENLKGLDLLSRVIDTDLDYLRGKFHEEWEVLNKINNELKTYIDCQE